MAYSTSTLAQGCFGKVYKQKYNDTWAAIKKVPQHLISKKDLERECDVYKFSVIQVIVIQMNLCSSGLEVFFWKTFRLLPKRLRIEGETFSKRKLKVQMNTNKANHPNIVKLLGNITLTDGKWIIPLEFIFGEDLETTIFKATKSKIQLTPAVKNTIIIGMCEGLLHLHSKDIVHQDLKPENIMVEHSTNRAVIIDLGLAKFFRHGLNSAIDMGNEAYSAPEVLNRQSQRDQRSDVWAMGKMIAELCARIRLYTPTVCPAKIKETLKDQPYCTAVCRMVEADPSLRASMAGIMSEIRRAGGAGIVTNTPVQTDHLKPPSLNNDVRNRSPSPMNRGKSPLNRNVSPNRPQLPQNRDLSPMDRAALPYKRNHSPIIRAREPLNRDKSPVNRAGSNLMMDPSPIKRPSLLPNLDYPDKPDTKALWPPTVPKGGNDLSQDFSKIMLYQEAAKNLPCDLPTTGRIVVRRFEEENGAVRSWEQKEVVTRDGKIVKYDDVKFNSK